MGLKEQIQKAAQSAFKAFEDVRTQITYNSVGAVTYNATTGAITPTVTTKSVYVLTSRVKNEEIDNALVYPDDMRLTIPYRDLSPIVPNLKDYVVLNGENWEVVFVRHDPAFAVWALQVRRP
jgi:hypothetical protein